MLSLRNKYLFVSAAFLVFLSLTGFYVRHYPTPLTKLAPSTTPPADAPKEPYPKYKPEPLVSIPPIVDNFPFAAAAHSAAELPSIPSWAQPPSKHYEEDTPLFIGFTRNWRLLQQVVVSYINAGWPPSDIYVVENTGVMDSNAKGRLSLQNPFFLNHTRLEMFGVNILRTPTLLSFAQLQNFFLHTAIDNKWPVFYWGHMDVIAASFEGEYADQHPESVGADADHSNFKTLYKNAVQILRDTYTLKPPDSRWAMRFFNYDRLALVNVEAFVDVGGWDTMIPYYMTDCDMHSRLSMAKYDIKDLPAGFLADVASSLDDLIVLYRKNNTGVVASFTDPNKIEEELELAAEELKKKGGKKRTTIFAREEDKKAEIEKKPEDEGEKKVDVKEIEKPKEPTKGESTEEAKSKETDPSRQEWTKVALNKIHDVADTTLPGHQSKWHDDIINSPDFVHLIGVITAMEVSKGQSKHGRNVWQARQKGGEGEPFYRDAAGFDQAVQMTIEHGRAVFSEKWGHRGCDIREVGLAPMDAWRVEHDF